MFLLQLLDVSGDTIYTCQVLNLFMKTVTENIHQQRLLADKAK